jgi:hypothetical protein
MTELPASLPGRPLYVNIAGGKLYISAHDAFHLKKQREFRRLIRAAHPDRNHCNWAPGRTRKLLKARARWEKAEARWYAHFGLEPPTGSSRNAIRYVETDRVLLLPYPHHSALSSATHVCGRN